MARVTCAISGIKFTASYFDSLNLQHTEGYIHPIFAVDRQLLYPYYREHCLGKLTAVDSYLLFLAFLHSSEKITWKYPASCNPQLPQVRQLIEHNLSQLIAVLEKTDLISHPHFEQPDFKVYFETSDLRQIPNWIEAWESNISYFYSKKADQLDIEELQKLENKLTYHIMGAEPPEKYARVIASWAAKAADFPAADAVLWKETIRSCFSITKMFNTPLTLLKEIKDYIECNIPVGSIHFHSISAVLKEGIAKHEDYLGGSSLALGYTLLPTLDNFGKQIISASELKGKAEVATIAAKASETYPQRKDYASAIDFLKAKLAYRVAASIIAGQEPAPKPKVQLMVDAKKGMPLVVSLLDIDLALPDSYSEPAEVLEENLGTEDYTLDSEDLDGLTIIDDNEEG
jgi:hypothetical protein